ncbi:rhodanese-like domain-containing protein [Pseudoalteromonas phenolica]|uniref:Phage shock protein E n=1 Tax=Pseudoalteromonas phenolica TaxID=161398 RepID=A0A0S2JXR5_9GAMM|nr:rhodanese-like domain-containing protein [Pseudoalteromonas phenolica]ALO40797.1 Phage shock protein E [Pseudoalteromonas phenolica]MBE0354684.1 phage shock protein E [Pseudoalteromonas phenolica O-BC30]RXF04939.1 rhodanese-like domain-containing protein [Pseudoalteromonas phenolica O-BC30]TMO52907.1 rhodanese-like domain-containing protein [Pseudoalteromonas phenolica]
MRFVLLLSLLLCSFITLGKTEQISQQALLINQMSAIPHKIIDVRSPEEFAAGHVKGAINIPFNQIDQHQDLLNTLKENTLVVYCRSGRRAGIFERALSKDGFTLLHLTGDMNSWQAENLPTVK